MDSVFRHTISLITRRFTTCRALHVIITLMGHTGLSPCAYRETKAATAPSMLLPTTLAASRAFMMKTATSVSPPHTTHSDIEPFQTTRHRSSAATVDIFITTISALSTWADVCTTPSSGVSSRPTHTYKHPKTRRTTIDIRIV